MTNSTTVAPAIVVYSKPQCGQCTATYLALDKAKIDYDVIDISEDAAARSYVMGLGHLQAPVVVVNGGEKHWSGFRRQEIAELAAAVAAAA